MDPNNKSKRPPPLPSFGKSKIQQPKKDNQLQKKLDSFFTQISKQSNKECNVERQVQKQIKQVQHNQINVEQKLNVEQANLQPIDKKKLSLASINSKLNSMLTSKKISLNTGVSKATESNKTGNLNPQKVQKKRSQIAVQYDPNTPNDYNYAKNYYRQKFNLLEKDSDDEDELSKKTKILNKTSLGLQKIADQMQNQEIQARAQQEDNQLQQKEEIALRMMQKFGYKVGTGLGKQSQGITTPLTIKKTTNTSCIIQQSSINLNQIIKPQISAKNALLANGVTVTQVIVLVNLVKMSEFNEEVQKQLKLQCNTFGEIKNWIVFLLKDHQGKQELRIFVQYFTKQSSFNAFLKLNNRYYNENLVSIRFYPKDQFQTYKLNLSMHGHIQT